MQPAVSEWVEFAEADYDAAIRLNRVRKLPLYNIVCFHAQQSAEKYLKARLEHAGIAFPRTHDLIALLTLALAVEPGWLALQPSCGAITDYAVDYRYPGFTASRQDASEALIAVRTIRAAVRLSLGLPP